MAGFLPNIFVAQTLKKLGIQNAKLEKELPKMVEKGLQRLYNFQRQDGGWGWQADNTHPFMTAYVIFGLSQAKSAGFEVDESVYRRGKESLKNQLNGLSTVTGWGTIREQDVDDTRVYMLYALAMADSPLQDKTLAMYDKFMTISNNYTLSLLALTLNKMGNIDLSKKVVGHLAKNAAKNDLGTYWEASSWHYSWMSSNYETTAYAILALSQIDLSDNEALISDAIRYLIANRRGGSWLSTKDTAIIIYAFADYVTRTSELSPSYIVSVFLNGKLAKTFNVIPRDAFLEGVILTIPEDDLVSGDNILKINMEGTGKPYYTATLKYYDTQQSLPAGSNGITVERQYSSDEAGIGEDIEVLLRITSELDCQYVVVEDYLPSGCSVCEGIESSGQSARREIHDEKVAFLITYVPAGANELRYTLRSEMPGDFVVLPAYAYMMYEPDVRGNSKESKLSVKYAESNKISTWIKGFKSWAPLNLYTPRVSEADGAVHLTWQEPAQEPVPINPDSYNIYRSTKQISNMPKPVPLKTGVKELTYTDLPLTDGEYYYAVSSVFNNINNIESPLSNMISAISSRNKSITEPTSEIPVDIAIYTRSTCWISKDEAGKQASLIINNLQKKVNSIEIVGGYDLPGWILSHIKNGQPDIILLFGDIPDSIYPSGNKQPDRSLAEEFLDDGNIFLNTADYIFYGNGRNGGGGLINMMDISTEMWSNGILMKVTEVSKELTPSLRDFVTYRPFKLNHLKGTDWEVENSFASNGDEFADPVIVKNKKTQGRIGIIYQAGESDLPRAQVISEIILNWLPTVLSRR